MESEINFNSTPSPESSFDPPERDDDKKKEKKKDKRRSFADELLAKRSVKPEKAADDKKQEKEPTTKELAKEFLDHKASELKDELENPTSIAHSSELQADLDLVEAITDKIDDPDKEVEPAVQEAYEELMEALTDAESDVDTNPETPPSDEEESAVAPSTSALPRIPVPFTPSTSGSSSSGGGSGTPPPSTPPASPPPPPPRRPIPPLPPVGAVPPVPTPNFNVQPQTTPEAVDDRRRVAGKMLVAGAVGYMIGRRGGRKRTEAKLEPEIKKRDETIVDLKKDIEQKEVSIRQTARQRERSEILAAAALRDTQEKTPDLAKSKEQIANRLETEDPGMEKESPSVIRQLADPVEKSERIETVSTPTPNNQQPVSNEAQPVRVEQITTPHLLHMAEKIKVLDTTVKQLYETNQINRAGLEELVKEHLAGRDISPVLDRRLLGKEAINERAHEYRHDPTTFGSSDDKKQDDSPTPVEKGQIFDVSHPLTKSDAAPKEKPPLNVTPPDSTEPISRAHLEKELAKKAKSNRMTAVGVTVVIAIILALLLVRVLFAS